MNFKVCKWGLSIFYFCLLFILSIQLQAQQPLYIAQSKTFGGSLGDAGQAIELSVDSTELFLGGRSFSSDFYLPGNNGGFDYWIMRTTLDGDTLWSNHFGGSNSDVLNALLPQPDGSVFGFGTTYSDLNEFGTLEGLFGAWLMLTNPEGDLIFGKMFSSNISEKGIDIVETNETLITVLGETASNELDGEMNHGITDFFVSRLTKTGIIAWTKLLGGSDMDTPSAMKKTNDAGLIIAGSSKSNGGDVDTNRGGFDVWIVKLLPSGDIEWSKTYGGSGDDMGQDILPLDDGGFLVVGSTTSEDGDVSENGSGEIDLWIIKIDQEGNLLWERRYGGSENDIGLGITTHQNGTYVVTGSTESLDNDLSGNKGQFDEWVIHMDGNGHIIRQMNYGGSGVDIPFAVTSSQTEVYILGGSNSTDGTLPTQNLPGENMWLLKMSSDTFACSESLICRQDTITGSNIIKVDSDAGISCINGCTVGLDDGPSFFQSNCPGVGNEAAMIMVYTDENADFMTLSVESGEFNIPYIVIARSLNCVNFTPIECGFGNNGSTLIQNIPVEPNTLYTVIVSDAEGNVGDFELCVSVINVEHCNIESNLYAASTSMGSPLSGPFLPGEEVMMCYELNDWEKLECNGVQGIVPSFGIGWDSISFNAFGQPIQIDTGLANIAEGSWDWYPLGAVNYNTFNPVNGLEGGQGMPAGWYFLNTEGPPPNTNPNETTGDISLCTPTDDQWKVCFTLKTRSECTQNMDCSVAVKTYSDGELGVNTSLACGYDAELIFATELNCCINPRIQSIPDLNRCTGDTIAFSISSNIPGIVTYAWTVISADPGITGQNNGGGQTFLQTLENLEDFDQNITYQIDASAEFCSAEPEIFTITVRPKPRTTMSLISSDVICSGEQIELQFNNQGLGPYFVFLAANGSLLDTLLLENETESIILTPEISTQYAAVGFSDQNCIGEASGIVNITVLPNPEVNLNEVICEGEVFRIGELTFDSPGQYSVTISGGSVNGCDSTVNLVLGVAQPQTFDLDTFICIDEVFVFGGDTFTTSGVYPFIFQDQYGCDSTIRINLTIDNETTNETMQTICNGSSVIFKGQEYFNTGIYTDTTFVGNGCYIVDVLNLNVLPPILVENLTINPDNGSGTGAIFLDMTGGTPPYTFLWSNGATTESITDLQSGEYTVGVQDDLGCTSEFVFNVPLGTATKEQSALMRQIRIFPNPVPHHQSLMIEYMAEKQNQSVEVSMIDIFGQVISTPNEIRAGQKTRLNPNSTLAGIYFVRIEKDGVVITQKVVLQE